MLILLLLAAAALAAGFPVALVAVAGLAAFAPYLFLVLVAAWAAFSARRRRRRRPGPEDEVRYFQAVAGELRGGASLRSALVDAAAGSPRLPLHNVVRRAASGRPLDEVGSALQSALPGHGPLAAAAVRIAGLTGGGASGVFAGLAARAAHDAELAAERRALTAQARLSALVIAAAPLALTGLVMLAGGPTFLDTGSSGLVLGGIGLAFQAAGGVVVWAMLRRAEQ